MKKFHMMLPERLGLIVLAILLLTFAVLLLTRGCGTDSPSQVLPDKTLIESISKDSTKTDTITKTKKTTKSAPKKPKNPKSPTPPTSATTSTSPPNKLDTTYS
ncbi:MAG: hypothetical protein LIP09_14835 [Bacteroidales bacterium]|nr:hypothetical protein [Bacteroidales bacterium]